MQWSDIPFHPPPRTLRQFAAIALVLFGALALWMGLARDRPRAAAVFGALALAIGPLGLARPSAIRPVFVGWMVLAFPIGWMVTHIVLACLFYGLFTPIAFGFRLFGRDVLSLRPMRDKSTYFVPKPPPADVRSHFRQY